MSALLNAQDSGRLQPDGTQTVPYKDTFPVQTTCKYTHSNDVRTTTTGEKLWYIM